MYDSADTENSWTEVFFFGLLYIFLLPPHPRHLCVIPLLFLCLNLSTSLFFLSWISFITQPFPCSRSPRWICPPCAPLWMVGLWHHHDRAPAVWAWIALLFHCFSRSVPLFFNFPSHLLSPISMSLFVCPSPSPALLISHNLYLFSFLFSRGGSRKLWRVQSSGRGSEEHWSWQLLVHEQTVGRNPGKHVWEKM